MLIVLAYPTGLDSIPDTSISGIRGGRTSISVSLFAEELFFSQLQIRRKAGKRIERYDFFISMVCQ
jgi:hypothetical protein